MRNATLTLLAALSLASCSQKELTSGINKKNMDTLVKPGDNFAMYVNGTWMKTAKIPADKSSYGAFDMLYDQSQKDVKAIIEEAAKGNNAEGTDEQKIGDYYASFMDRKGRDAKGIAPIQPELKAIDAIASYDDLAAYFGKANRAGVDIPFSVSVMSDFKDPTKHTLITWQGGLGLPEREYYLATDAKMTDIRQKYVAHIEKMFQLTNMPNPAESAAKIMALETALASQQMKKEDTRDIVKLYNAYAVKDLKTLMPDFNWTAMLKNAGVAQEKKLVVTQVDYTKSLNNLIKNTPIDTWKTYLKWGVINGSAGLLTTALDKQNFEFYGKNLYGTESQQEDWKRAVEMVNGGLGEVVGKVYVKKHFSPEAKERMTQMVKNLLKAYAESIKTLDWMSAATKKEALKKVDNFMIKIGYPDQWRDYSALKIVKNDLYGNATRATEFEYNRNLAKLGKPVDRAEWGMNPQTVNAYYNPSLNEIVFPAAILKPPFFDLNADDAVNYGGIGAVIGHEISHGFDDSGSRYNADGNLVNWWTDEDLKQFTALGTALADQYSALEPLPGTKVDGKFTLGENIGDLGGINAAYDGLQLYLKEKGNPGLIDGYTPEQRFFISWATVWRTKMRDEAIKNQVKTDPHSPGMYRAYVPLQNVEAFYKAFNIQPNNGMYLKPEDRVKIW